MLVIPREKRMVCLYVCVASSADADWDPGRTVTRADTQSRARRILQPYSIAWEHVDWFSTYPIQ